MNVNKFLATVKKYTNINQLTLEIVNELIDVHKRNKKHAKKSYTENRNLL
ncbi:DUF4368 domain-containing protein [Candidatus Enterococcus murrayae]|uniref:DUF4368 domain-containing protein n=1 Tax=Candidatus Enterococcus murrayae TaxID=2815321 RepID=A0ABS3HKX8_9ENTE|nr:DUF4368 domain-containing protein [Enterococcus sp. MJM16]